MLRSSAFQRNAGRTAILTFTVLFAAACGGGTVADRTAALGPSVPSLGTAANFAALGGAGVTCTSPNPPLPAVTISGGDVGSLLAAPTSVTGFPNFTPGALPCSLSGTVQLGAAAGFADFITAYTSIANMPCPADAAHNLSGDLGGMTLPAGLYCISGVGLLTSQLTLSGGPTDTWIFKAASSITPIGGSVVMAGGANACNVYWQLGTAASFDNTHFAGNVLAGSAITFTGTSSSLAGRALAQTDVTLTGASIAACTASGGGGGGGGHCKLHKARSGEDEDGDDCDEGGHDKDRHDKDGHDKDGHEKNRHDDREGRGD